MSKTDSKSISYAKKRLSISLHLPLLFIVSFIWIIVAVILLVYFRFEKRTVDDYADMAELADAYGSACAMIVKKYRSHDYVRPFLFIYVVIAKLRYISCIITPLLSCGAFPT